MFFLYLLATVQILIFAPPKDLRHRIQEHPGDISDDYVQMLVMLSDHFFRMYIYVYIYNIIYIIYIHTSSNFTRFQRGSRASATR